ncbi:hypothetical protein F9U64_01195 [Gracilibacillus oryzae]|uniref:Uncharacterized protein n=1 Tax=Gracilibacillus oryzae TaxID=1672701 RepID=A0A7C8GX11_9BACI|nr:hypothetical protein [Gracilibacillus oryzae]KAB8139269.1 hypothetical protein F9U64_01195 [Gracilibacillus oryzae]
MALQIKDDNNIPQLVKIIHEMKSKQVEIGVFGDDDEHMVMVASVNEFGMDIKPKKSKYLTIPANKKAKGKSAGDFNNLFFIETENGNGLLAKEKGKDQIEVYFVLVKSVTIPERSFIRSTYDEEENKLVRLADRLLVQVLEGNLTVENYYGRIGEYLISKIQATMKNMSSPPNSGATSEAKGSSNPLIDTGRLRQSITWRVTNV